MFNDNDLVRKVLKPVYTIIMIENAFMTHYAWYWATKRIICGYNQMPVIRDNIQWSIVEFLDGFGFHEFESCSLDMRAKRNILSAKEESKTYHVNQSHNQLVAKNGNKKATDTVSCQRKMKHVNEGIVDQYQLVFTVNELTKNTTKQMCRS